MKKSLNIKSNWNNVYMYEYLPTDSACAVITRLVLLILYKALNDILSPIAFQYGD